MVNYWYYLQDEYVLQISTDEKTGAIVDSVIWKEIAEVFPANAEDWAMWLGFIGFKDFTGPDLPSYNRVFPEGGDRVEPVETRERLTDDPLIPEITRVKHKFAIYSREVPETKGEFIMPDCVEDDEGAYIRVMVGITLDLGNGKIGDSGFITVM